jgi:polar amino acid transport system substrate-binding protein
MMVHPSQAEKGAPELPDSACRILRSFSVLLSLLSLPTARLSADTLDDVRQRGVLRWAGDEEGGAPYIIAADDKTLPGGFEGELLAELSKRLGVRSEFKQCQWDNLGDLLRARGTDIICNGVELRPDRLQSNICTIPYYVNDLQLLARKGDDQLRGWADVSHAPVGRKWRIGVLADTAAERYLQENYAEQVETVAYPGTTQAMDHVRDRQLDATLTDWMAANTYLDRYPTLQMIGDSVGRGYFVIYLRTGDERLRDELNSGLREMLAGGRLKRIYEKYKIWNGAQQSLTDPEVQAAPERIQPSEGRKRGWSVIRENLPVLLKSAAMTVLLSLLSMPLAVGIGLTVAIGRLYGPRLIRIVLTLYVEILRGTPLLLQLFVIFYLIPSVVELPTWLSEYYPLVAAVLGLGINYSAYEAEIYRAGLLAIPRGQTEAALALGMSRGQTLRHVVLPQAVRLVVPPVTNDFIALFKDTSVCSVITVVELSKRYSIVANNTGAYVEIAAVTALLYLIMSYPLALLTRRLEKRTPAINV